MKLVFVFDTNQTRLIFYQIPNLATNDAGQLSLTEYAVLAIAPQFAPNTARLTVENKQQEDWERSTLASEKGEVIDKETSTNSTGKKRGWRMLLCMI